MPCSCLICLLFISKSLQLYNIPNAYENSRAHTSRLASTRWTWTSLLLTCYPRNLRGNTCFLFTLEKVSISAMSPTKLIQHLKMGLPVNIQHGFIFFLSFSGLNTHKFFFSPFPWFIESFYCSLRTTNTFFRRLFEFLMIHSNIWNTLTICKQLNNVEWNYYWEIAILETL